MRVLILNAGKGVRFFGPQEDEYHKCLLKLNGETILDRQIRLLNMAGLTDITVVIDAKSGQKIKDVLIGKNVKVIEVTCYREYYEKNWTLFQCKHLFSETLVLNGDVIFSEVTIPKVLSFFNQKTDKDIIFVGWLQYNQWYDRAPPYKRDELFMFIMNERGAEILKNFTNPFGKMLWEDTKFWDLYRSFRRKPLFQLGVEDAQDVDFPEDLEYWKREKLFK